ncbi:MAG: phasin family protein [Pseudomonadota bacterium]
MAGEIETPSVAAPEAPAPVDVAANPAAEAVQGTRSAVKGSAKRGRKARDPQAVAAKPDDAPAAETAVAETLAEETPVAETPVAESLADETLADETLAQETPAEETPAEETPVAETPVAELAASDPVLPAPATPALKTRSKPTAKAAVEKPARAKPAPVRKLKLASITPARPAPQKAVMPAELAKTVRVPTPKYTPKKPVVGTPTLLQIKEKLMAQTIQTDIVSPFQTAFADMQEKAKTAYAKSTEALGEANDFAKGNVEAIVESGKLLASGLQELGSTVVADSRSAFETITADVKELASVKSPTEFFQLQSVMLRKTFDGAVAQASKNTEAMMKLATEAFLPISSRVSLAVEKVSKAA